MLQQIRDKISGWFAALFLGAIAVVFIFWGIQFESTVTSAAAKVNGESVPVQEVRRAWQERQSELQRLTRDELPEQLVKAEQEKVLTQFIQRELLVQRANKMGYRVSDREMVESLGQIEALQVDGKFSPDRYKALLRAQGRSEVEFERSYRRDLEIGQLRNAIGLSAFATPGELRRRVELEGETRDVDYVTLPAASFAAAAQASAQEVAAWYEAHKADYMTQESVALQYLQLNLADVAATVQVTDEGLKAYYDQVAQERYVEQERRRARHILVEAGRDDAAALKKAEQLLARAKAGEDFAALAAADSDDPGSKAQGGELGWATRETFVKPFADALFSMQKGEIRGPIKTQFGYHVIQLEDVAPERQRSFDEVRAELEADYRRDQAQSTFYEKSQQLADESFAALTELDSVAKKLGLTVQTVTGFTRQGGGPFDADRKVIDAAFSNEVLEDRQNSQPIEVGTESVVVLRVADHKPSVQRPLDEVRTDIEATLHAAAARKAALAAAKAAEASIASGESLADAAKKLGVQPAGVTTVTRTTDTVPAPLLKAAFAVPQPVQGKVSAGTAELPNGDAALFVVSSVRKGTLESPEMAARAADLRQRAQGQAGAFEFDAYLRELERTATIKRNEKVFE